MKTRYKNPAEAGNAVVIGVIALAVIVGGFFLVSNRAAVTQDSDTAMMQEDTGNEHGNVMVEEDGSAMMEEGEGAMMEADTVMTETQVAGSYEVYGPEKLVLADEGDVVLFFHATWCPSCRAADKAISGASSIPSGLTILKLDYDKETDLRKKYGVTTQHSFVQVDAQGTLVKKWIGSSSVADIEAQVI